MIPILILYVVSVILFYIVVRLDFKLFVGEGNAFVALIFMFIPFINTLVTFVLIISLVIDRLEKIDLNKATLRFFMIKKDKN